MRQNSFGQTKKSLITKITERTRINKISTLMPSKATVLDLGCGYNANFLQTILNKTKKVYGIDLAVNQKIKNIILIQNRVDARIPLENNSLDVVTAMAIIEHVENPYMLLSEAYRVLKKGGKLLLTTPSHRAKPFLDFFATIGLDSKEEISDHKRYYTIPKLDKELARAGFKHHKSSSFALFGLNLLGIGEK
ncbi:MAG: methyltransferase domain-containing protein [bacterium]